VGTNLASDVAAFVQGVLTPSSADGRPSSSIVQLDSPRKHATVSGLLPICGWAFIREAAFPEGVVELAIDDETRWAELLNRLFVGGIDPSVQWAKRCGFQAAVNTFLLPNGVHRVRVRVKNSSGRIAATRDVKIKVDNVGKLAETTTRLLKAYPNAKRIWTDIIDSGDFPYAEGRDVAWFDRPDAESRVTEILKRHQLSPSYEPHFHKFIREGYLVLDQLVAKDWCDRINSDLDRLINSGTFKYGYPGQRVEKLFEHSKAARDLWAHPEILKILSAIYDDEALPCQTLNFIHGSQQDVHQDVVHLTPFPAGMMCGAWVALEDIHNDAGPLVVYPGSHKLPRLYTRTVPVDKVRDDTKWSEFVAKYSPAVMELITNAGLKPIYYTPKVGSILIWHENLAHGGSPRKCDTITRKSMVSHYFAKGAIAYYDSTGLPGWTYDDD